MVLRAGYLVIAQKLQEAATAMCHEDIRIRLTDALNDAFRGTGNWGYVVAVFGDDKAGDVVYSCNSDLKKAGYTISGANTKIETEAAVDVQPLTTYEVETVEAREVGARNSRRDLRQLQTIHDSAKALGANCSMAESAIVPRETKIGTLVLVESTAWAEELLLIESSGREVEIKLIAPGKGATAFYPADVLKRDGPEVFKKNTQIYINHATRAEESARPEGDWHKLVGALSTDAYWKEGAKHGDGLFAMAKFASGIAESVIEKAPYSGMSIRANGNALMEAGRPVLREGVPILAAFTGVESVDVVTRAGAGGMILTEAAVPANPTQEAAMDAAEIQRLIEAATQPLRDRALRGDAAVEANRLLEWVTLPGASKMRIVETLLRETLPVKDGALDATAFADLVNAEAKREGAYVASLTGAGRVTGMGSAPVSDPASETKLREVSKATYQRAHDVFSEFGIPAAAAKAIAAGYGEAA